jgi:hypothetical protein
VAQHEGLIILQSQNESRYKRILHRFRHYLVILRKMTWLAKSRQHEQSKGRRYSLSELLVQLLQELAHTALHFVHSFTNVRIARLCVGVRMSYNGSFMLARTIDLLVHVVRDAMGVGPRHLSSSASILELTVTARGWGGHWLILLRREAR